MSYRTDENGNYVRTVRCGNCWGKGHNKSKCPEEKARYERAKLEDPDSWFVADYERRKAKRSKRACGYCREGGHTRRTCQHFVNDKQKTVTLNKEWRAQALDFFKNLGLGVGSLVSVRHRRSWGEDGPAQACLVASISWEDLTFQIKRGGNSRYTLRLRPLDNFASQAGIEFPIDPAGVVTPASKYGTFVKVLGPISPTMVEANVPDSWLDGDGEAVENMFMDDGKPVQRGCINWVAQ
jgi:hypothetical protein